MNLLLPATALPVSACPRMPRPADLPATHTIEQPTSVRTPWRFGRAVDQYVVVLDVAVDHVHLDELLEAAEAILKLHEQHTYKNIFTRSEMERSEILSLRIVYGVW